MHYLTINLYATILPRSFNLINSVPPIIKLLKTKSGEKGKMPLFCQCFLKSGPPPTIFCKLCMLHCNKKNVPLKAVLDEEWISSLTCHLRKIITCNIYLEINYASKIAISLRKFCGYLGFPTQNIFKKILSYQWR